jgi:hypothetical protein
MTRARAGTKATDNGIVVTRGDDFAEVKVHPKTPTSCSPRASCRGSPPTAARRSRPCAARPAATTTTASGSIPTTRHHDHGVDQGAIVTVNGGQTWSIWYNQPTAQFYHVSTDNAFPYRVCGGQQESGSACVQSRSDDGRITFREWHPVGVEEYGYVAPTRSTPTSSTAARSRATTGGPAK